MKIRPKFCVPLLVVFISRYMSAQCEENLAPAITADVLISGACNFPQPSFVLTDESPGTVTVDVQTLVSFTEVEDVFTAELPADNPCLYGAAAGFMLFGVPTVYKYWTIDNGTFEILPDGSAHLTTLMTNTTNPNGKLMADVYFGPGMSWSEWETSPGQNGLPAPHGYKADCGGVDGNAETWTYRILLPGSTVTGLGDYSGSSFTLSHAPANYYFGYQHGTGANNYSPEYGSGGWFQANGLLNDASTGQSLSLNNQPGDFTLAHGEAYEQINITRIYTATDACGEVSSFTQEIEVCDNPGPLLLNMPWAGQTMSLCEFANWQPEWVSECGGDITYEILVENAGNIGSDPILHQVVCNGTDACGQSNSFSFDLWLYSDGPCNENLMCAGDFDQNNVVGSGDLNLFIGVFNTDSPAYDLTGDSSVNMMDFLVFISQYGSICAAQN